MNPPPSLALVINTFNQPEYLARVLHAVARQAAPPDEVILADDGSDPETRRRFEQWPGRSRFRCEHIWQPHNGFRRAQILNRAIATARADYVVFLDGDTVPHPAFVTDHRALARPHQSVQGHRALIGRKAAAYFGTGEFAGDRRRALLAGQIRGLKHAFRWPWPLRRRRADLAGVRGCNLAVWRSDLIRVNGYNEAFVGWGREDSELIVRLMNCGVVRLDVRGRALCYHLWHPLVSRAQLADNDALLAAAIARAERRCERGLHQHRSTVS